MQLLDLLEELGLKSDEAKIYLSLLELGMTQVANIAHRSQIKRTTLYSILDKMEEQGVVSKHIKNKVAYYTAIHPDDLYGKYVQKVSTLQERLPELRALSNEYSKKTKVYYFEGIPNVSELYKIEVKDAPKQIRTLASNVDRDREDIRELADHRNKIIRSADHFPNKHLISNIELAPNDFPLHNGTLTKIPQDELDIKVSISVYEDKVRFISKKIPISGMMIEDRDIADTLKSMFDYIVRKSGE